MNHLAVKCGAGPCQMSVRCDSASCKRLTTVLLREFYGRYTIHKLCCILVSTLLGVYDVIVTKYCNVKVNG